MTRDQLSTLAQQCGATHFTPPPLRAVRGVSLTFEQLEAFAAALRAAPSSAGGYEFNRPLMEGNRIESIEGHERAGETLDAAGRRLYEAAFANGWARCMLAAQHVAEPGGGAGPAAVEPDARALPAEMDDELRDILGTMCFHAIHFAQAARAAGHQIATKAEAEQAAFIWWKLGHYLRHGAAEWRAAAVADLEAMKAEAGHA